MFVVHSRTDAIGTHCLLVPNGMTPEQHLEVLAKLDAARSALRYASRERARKHGWEQRAAYFESIGRIYT